MRLSLAVIALASAVERARADEHEAFLLCFLRETLAAAEWAAGSQDGPPDPASGEGIEKMLSGLGAALSCC